MIRNIVFDIGNVLAEFQFPEGAVEAVIPVMIIAHVVKGCSHVPA